MRLNRLEISGFKSFPDRADVAFDRGVTAIVGPNGCGKSNVVDAITWVLGEQSAKSLRGEHMQDVIFSGSDARKPTAAAEVRLRLNDVPSQAARQAATKRDPALGAAEGPGAGQLDLPAVEVRDVEIARRLYRSGESEYLIDGEVVRLRDVQDLLMDGGLGFKGYAVIEQGKIGQILSAKPTDRRLLIEEAAGVTKYRSRRRAAELKLEAAQQNLARVEDVIFELDRQRTSLKRQAAKARRYRRLRQELRRWEKVLFARRYRALTQAIEAARARLAAAREDEAAAAVALAGLEQQLGVTRAELSAGEARAAAAREAAHARELEAERRQQQIAFDRQQVDQLGESIERLGTEVAGLVERREPARAELAERRASAEQAEAERQQAADRLAREDAALAEAQKRAQTIEQQLDDARRQAFANSTTIATLHNVIERAREAAERLAAEMSRLDGESSDQRVEAERLAADRDRVALSLRDLQRAIEDTRAARAAAEAALACARTERERRSDALRAKERDAAALHARLTSLEELEAAREGYGEAARAILADPSIGLSHFGALADAVEADPAFERAVEACLGDLLQFVLVATDGDARRGLDVVRSRNLGRCGFLVVGGTWTARQGPLAEVPPPGLRSIASVTRIGGPHADAVRVALGDAWVAESFEVAALASRDVPGPVVTPQGDVFRNGRLISGGSRTETRGLLATKRELKELRGRVAIEHAAAADMAAQLANADRTITGHEQEVAALGAVLHGHEKAAIGAEVQVQRGGEDLERVARRLELIANERRRADEERQAQIARHDEARESITRHERLQQDFDQRVDETQALLAAARDDLANAAGRVAEARAAHAALVERSLGLGNEVRRLEDAGRELEQRIAGRSAEREASMFRRGELETAIVEGVRKAAEEQQALEAAREAVCAADAAVADLQQRFQAVETDTRRARVVVDDARAALGHLEVARATAESDLAHLASSCSEALQMTLDEVAAEVEALEALGQAEPDVVAGYGEDEADVEAEEELAAQVGREPSARTPEGASAAAEVEAEKARGLHAHATTAEEAIAELKAKIEGLGAVNMMAIEQFDELEQRHGFLSAQRQDLVESIAQTGEAIRRIDKTTRERFNEAFTAIQRNFDETFQTLFGGGRSGLVLIDESDVLESGIDIIAQPPGKRLQSVQLLSGGEKALTAMALMFGIFRYRPSPFCLLDEIDAPLDDANIGRFIEMLRGMLEHTQFVLVTHHRKTMEIADRLYGVTMEEPGVSKLISLKLN
jgi:chromosome segregation protein